MGAAALRRYATEHDVVEIEDTPFGTSNTVEGPLAAPDGRAPRVQPGQLLDQPPR